MVTAVRVPITRDPDADLLPYALVDAVSVGDPQPLAHLIWPAGPTAPAARHRVRALWALCVRYLGDTSTENLDATRTELAFLDYLVETPSLTAADPDAIAAACAMLPALLADQPSATGAPPKQHDPGDPVDIWDTGDTGDAGVAGGTGVLGQGTAPTRAPESQTRIDRCDYLAELATRAHITRPDALVGLALVAHWARAS